MSRTIALLLTVATGFTGLVYEVTWQKYVHTLLGSHSEASAAVLGIFLAGLSAGYSLFGRLTRRLVRRVRGAGVSGKLLIVYGVVEGGIGAYAALFPWFFEGARSVSYAIPHGPSGLGFSFDVLLVAALVGPPAVLMGGTIPILTQALSPDLRRASRIHALIYGFNTAGAFVGALAATFVLLPRLGLTDTLLWMSGVNLGAGLTYISLGLSSGAGFSAEEEREPQRRVEGITPFALVALLSGFAVMLIQTVVIRLGGLAMGSSEFTFGTVVAVFVLSIALGSFGVSLFSHISDRYLQIHQCVLVVLLALLYLPLQQAPYWAHLLRIRFDTTSDAFLSYHFASFLGVLAILGIPVMMSGAILPLLFNHLRREVGNLGGVAGRLYSWNTVGSLLGALLGGYALLFVLDLHHVYRIAVGALALSAAILIVRLSRRIRGAMVWAGLLAAFLILASLEPWKPEYLAMGLFRQNQPTAASLLGIERMAEERWASRSSRIVFHDDDPVSSVTVTEAKGHGQVAYSLLANGKPDGSTMGDYKTFALTGLIPAILAEKMERAFVIGFGTGITVGELASLRGVKQVVVAELSPAVIRAAPLFDFANLGARYHPKVQIIRSDAYRALMQSRETYDIIASQPSNPWVTGVEMLYSRDFLAAARQRLAPGGVYVQWLQQYEIDTESIALVLRTFTSVFGRVGIWYGQGPDLLLLGFDNDRFTPSLERTLARVSESDFRSGLHRAGIRNVSALLSHELIPVGVIESGDLPGSVHTLYRPILSYMAGAAFFSRASGRIPIAVSAKRARVGQRTSILGRYLSSRTDGDRKTALRQVAKEVCQQRSALCATALVEWTRWDPDSPVLEQLKKTAGTVGPLFGETVQPELLDQLARFYSPSTLEESEPVLLEDALLASNLYQTFYQYALPFNPKTLVSIWERCTARVKERAMCAEGLANARALVVSDSGA